jgi:PAS domain S-box-containing protein
MPRSRPSAQPTSIRARDSREEGAPFDAVPGNPEERNLPLRSVIDAIPGLVWSAFPNGEVEFCNQRWLDYTGMSFNDVKGWGWAAAIHPLDVMDVRKRWREALMQSACFRAEARLRGSDGYYRWFLLQATPLRDSNGPIVRWYGTYTDIEELKCAQEELQKQTSRLDELFEQAPEGVAVLSTDDRILRINHEFTRMFGYAPDEALQRSMNDLIVPDALAESSRAYTTLLREGGRVEVETVRRRKDGTEIAVSLLAVSVRTASGEHVVNYAIYRDITERKRAEDRLRESEARFQGMADTAPVLIWMTGTDGQCNYFNKPWLDFTGRTLEQEIGLGWTEGVHPHDLKGCFDCFLPAFEARKPFSMEYRIKRADGEYRWVIESGIPRYAGGGEFAGYIGSNIDITERKRAEEERERLRQAQADLAHINRVTTMGELTASLSHEIKQPIAAAATDARTCLKWLERDRPDIKEAREAASRIIKDVTRASEIITRTRSLFKKGEPQRELVDLNEIIREMVTLLYSEAGRYSISIRTQLSAELPSVRADKVQLQQVFMNLILNAIDAMNEMSAKRELILKSELNREDQLLISVSDNGAGLPSERADKIFNAFFTTKSQGTGMGLSISRSIIESHGGRLWATPNAERGTTFQFTLPADIEPA